MYLDILHLAFQTELSPPWPLCPSVRQSTWSSHQQPRNSVYHRETSRDALLESIVSTENPSVCLRL